MMNLFILMFVGHRLVRFLIGPLPRTTKCAVDLLTTCLVQEYIGMLERSEAPGKRIKRRKRRKKKKGLYL